MLSEKIYGAWLRRIEANPLAKLCFMSEDELFPIADKCIDIILRRFQDLPDRYKQSYKMSLQSRAREPLLTIILFCLYFLPKETPYECDPAVHTRLKEHVSNKMTGVYSTLQMFVDGVTMSAIVDPI